MKKQLLLLVIAGGALAVSASGAFAQIGIPVVGNPTLSSGQVQDAAVAAGATVITVSGIIEESLQFTAVESNIELGNIGGAAAAGTVSSVSGRRGAIAGTGEANTVAFTGTAPENNAGDGYARVDFISNTNIQVNFAGANVVGTAGPASGTNGVPARQLPTAYRVAPKGKVTYSNNVFFDGPGPTGQSPVSGGSYGSYIPTAVPVPVGATSTTAIPGLTLRFGGGGPTNTGAGTASAPNAPSGFLVEADITRSGTNDPAGTYSGTLNLTYSKF